MSSSGTTYTVEFAKSGRAKCKKCKEPIARDDMRIGTHASDEEASGTAYAMTSWYHPPCFSLPRKLSTGPNKIGAEEFVEDVLEDATAGEILPARKEEIVAAIESRPARKAKADSAAIEKLKAAWEQQQEGGEPPAKKVKGGGDDAEARKVKFYGVYHKGKNDELKDMLRWNRQVMTGTKGVLLLKVIDGCVYGRLARCKLCTGRLKLLDDGDTVKCSGSFDEDMQQRIDCAFQTTAAEAPRWQPWYTEEPTEEQDEEMDRLIAEAKGEEMPGDASSDPDVAALVKAAVMLPWDLSSRDGMRAAADDMIALLRGAANDRKVDLPEDASQAKQRVGQLIATNREKSADELIPLIVKEFGFSEDKKQKAVKKEEAISSMVAHPKNGPLVAALQELAELYFKEGNRNAGAVYVKAVKSLKELEYEVTADNALGLAKGKTKLEGIGKGTAEKIHEFCTTGGTIEKLEQKRAEAA